MEGWSMKYIGTLLPQSNNVTEIQRSLLDLLKKVNESVPTITSNTMLIENSIKSCWGTMNISMDAGDNTYIIVLPIEFTNSTSYIVNITIMDPSLDWTFTLVGTQSLGKNTRRFIVNRVGATQTAVAQWQAIGI